MRSLTKVVVASVLFASLPAAAEISTSGNIALTTDYKFRGISQSDGEAVSGGFDVDFGNGFYLGTWASSIEDWGNGIELDYYGGFAGETESGIGYDVGVLYYGYPNASTSQLDYLEFYASASISDITLGLAYSDDYFAGTGTFTYLYADYSYALSEEWSLDFHIANNDIEDNAGFGTPDYIDYSVGVSTELAGIGISLAWVGTDLSESDCFGGDDLCEDSAVLSFSKSL